MKRIFNSLASLVLAATLFQCNNSSDPQPIPGSETAHTMSAATGSQSAILAPGTTVSQGPITARPLWVLAKTITVPQHKGFNLTSPFAITSEAGGDIGWGDYGCYSALKPVKVLFNNLKIVDVASVTPALLKTLNFSAGAIANAPEGSAFWTNYMPAKTIIACKTPAGKYYLVEVLSDNPLKVNIYQPF